jgi:hypothetical protein
VVEPVRRRYFPSRFLQLLERQIAASPVFREALEKRGMTNEDLRRYIVESVNRADVLTPEFLEQERARASELMLTLRSTEVSAEAVETWLQGWSEPPTVEREQGQRQRLDLASTIALLALIVTILQLMVALKGDPSMSERDAQKIVEQAIKQVENEGLPPHADPRPPG